MSPHNDKTLLENRSPRRIIMVLCLTMGYMFAEFFGGLLSNSLSLLADAGHMLADVVALSISIVAFMLSVRPANNRASFGYRRAEVIAALINGVVLLLMSFFIIKEAIARFFVPQAIESHLMIAVAVGGLIVNIIGLFLLDRDKSHNLNVKGAWLHVLSDALSSIGVIISGILIALFNWTFADPVMSIGIACLVSYSALHLILETINVLMEHAPRHIDPEEVSLAILSVPHAKAVHDLHIWSITAGQEALSVHIVLMPGGDFFKLLHNVEKMLAERFGVTHTTIQIEQED